MVNHKIKYKNKLIPITEIEVMCKLWFYFAQSTGSDWIDVRKPILMFMAHDTCVTLYYQNSFLFIYFLSIKHIINWFIFILSVIKLNWYMFLVEFLLPLHEIIVTFRLKYTCTSEDY